MRSAHGCNVNIHIMEKIVYTLSLFKCKYMRTSIQREREKKLYLSFISYTALVVYGYLPVHMYYQRRGLVLGYACTQCAVRLYVRRLISVEVMCVCRRADCRLSTMHVRFMSTTEELSTRAHVCVRVYLPCSTLELAAGIIRL